MDRLHAMTVFAAVAEHGGFAAAGRVLNLAPPAVTRAVAGLEEHLGARLLIRTTRKVSLTEAGERYLEECRRILADIAEAEAAAAGAHGAPKGLLTVSAPQTFGRLHVLPILLDFLEEYAAVRARALFADRLVDLVGEGVDLAVRIAQLPDSALRAAKVGEVRRVICAAPTYLDRVGRPEKPEDLARHRIVAAAHEWGAEAWRLGADETLRVPIEPRLRVATIDSALEAALAGWGLTRLLSYQVADALEEGRLEAVLIEQEPAPTPVHVLHAQGGRVPAKLRLVFERMVERLRANPAIRPRG